MRRTTHSYTIDLNKNELKTDFSNGALREKEINDPTPTKYYDIFDGL